MACGRHGSIARRDFEIGEIDSRTDRTTHAIRWYEAQGLILA